MALGEFGIDGEPKLSARLCGRNDFALRSGGGLLRSRHVVSSFRYILQYMYMRLGDHAPIDGAQRSSLGASVGRVVGSMHEETMDSNQHHARQFEP